MIISNTKEFRLLLPGHAIDSIDPFLGVLDNSEHDFLAEKLGTPLYDKLCEWYGYHSPDGIETQTTSRFNRLLILSQRAVAYDAMSRAIGQHIISINNAGVNIPTADDYGKVDLDAVETFKKSCIKEAHAAINRLLQTLEEWSKQFSASVGSADATPNETPTDEELSTIVTLWKQSRYYYLSTSLLIPCAQTMQTYWNIYDSREKFIQMLPDLLYIQEEIIAPAIGEDFTEALISSGNILAPISPATVSGGSAAAPPIALRTLHKLRKVMAVMAEHRTLVISTAATRRQTAHDEAVRLLQSAIDYIKAHQEDYAAAPALYAALQKSPLYVAPATAAECPCQSQKFRNNRADSAIFVTPALN